jgi:hypothetical protein
MTSVFPQLLYAIFPTICFACTLLDFAGYDRQSIYDVAWWISIVYFISDLIVEISRRNLVYIAHHTACLTLLSLKMFWHDQKQYSDFMHLGLTMELSNLFFNLRPILKKGSTSATINDACFALVWYISRLGYSLPRTIHLIVVEKVDGGFPRVMITIVVGLTVLHIYWAILIFRKSMRTLFPGQTKGE